MIEVKCPYCGAINLIPHCSLGTHVGCVNCFQIYILSLEIYSRQDKQVLVLIAVLLFIIIGIIFFKLQLDHKVVSRAIFTTKRVVKKAMLGPEEIDQQLYRELSFMEFDSAYGTKAQRLKWKRPRLLPRHKGRQVQWTGEVIEVGVAKQSIYGSYYVKFKHIYTSGSDVTVYFSESEGYTLIDLETGLAAKYNATIVFSGYAQKNHVLNRGQIIVEQDPFPN